jgi:hypothetical protein
MAMIPQPQGSNLDQAFVADRADFWVRFTKFVKFGCVAMVLLLLFLLVFIY